MLMVKQRYDVRSAVSCIAALSLMIASMACLTLEAQAAESALERTSLDELWERHMLAGTSFWLITSKESRSAPYESKLHNPAQSVGDASLHQQGIMIEDMQETWLWGLFSHGGWRLEGGLLGKIEMGNGVIELYGKSVWHTRPVLFHFGISPPRSARNWYDFFLLIRLKNAEAAELASKWSIPPDRLPYDYPLRGQLQYDGEKQLATVIITGKTDNRVILEEKVELCRVAPSACP